MTQTNDAKTPQSAAHKPKAPKPQVAVASRRTFLSDLVGARPAPKRKVASQDSETTQATVSAREKSAARIQAAQNTQDAHAHVQAQAHISTRAAQREQDREADKKSMGQVRKTMLFLFAVVIIYALYLVFTGQVDEFVTSLAGVDLGWIIAGVVCFLFYYVFGVLAYVLSIVTDPHCPVGIRDLMSVEASGVFFMRLTPNGAGAPPAQIYRLMRAGLSMGQAGALQFTRFVIYEAGEGVFAAIMLIFCGGYFYQTFGDVTLIGVALFGFKILQMAIMLALCLLPRPIMFVGNRVLRFVNRRGWLKDDKYKKYYDFINTQVMDFSHAFKAAAKNVREMLLTLVVTLVQLGCMYALPFFVLRAFGEPADLLICMASGSMLELLINAIPLPGGTGGAEVGFAYLYGGMFGSHLAAGFVIWRAVEYLLPVLIAAPCMGMRSDGRISIHDRWMNIYGRIQSFIAGDSSARMIISSTKATGLTVHPKLAKTTAKSAAKSAAKSGAKSAAKSTAKSSMKRQKSKTTKKPKNLS